MSRAAAGRSAGAPLRARSFRLKSKNARIRSREPMRHGASGARDVTLATDDQRFDAGPLRGGVRDGALMAFGPRPALSAGTGGWCRRRRNVGWAPGRISKCPCLPKAGCLRLQAGSGQQGKATTWRPRSGRPRRNRSRPKPRRAKKGLRRPWNGSSRAVRRRRKSRDFKTRRPVPERARNGHVPLRAEPSHAPPFSIRSRICPAPGVLGAGHGRRRARMARSRERPQELPQERPESAIRPD